MYKTRIRNDAVTILVAMSSLAGCPIASAAEQVVSCPPELPANAIKVDSPKGFVAHVSTGMSLSGAVLMYGPPDRMQTAVPTISTKRGGKEVASWTDLANVESKWMACGYGPEQTILVSQQIDRRAKTCTVAASKTKGSETYDVRCTW